MTTQRKPDEMPICKLDNCSLGTVANDCCLFHSRITPSLWGAVNLVLKTEEGQTIIIHSRRNRELWAVGVEEEKATCLYEKDKDGNRLTFNAHARLFRELRKLKDEGLLPEAVDLDNREQTINQVKRRSGYEIWLPNDSITRGVYFSLHWVCEAYENYLIAQVERMAAAIKGN